MDSSPPVPLNEECHIQPAPMAKDRVKVTALPLVNATNDRGNANVEKRRTKYCVRTLVAAICGLLIIATVLSAVYAKPRAVYDQTSPLQTARKKAIVEAFQHAWKGYSQNCFGHDILHPVTNMCEDDLGGYGATAIDALSTAIIFGEEEAVLQILRHIAALDLMKVAGGSKIQVFEVTIRHLAGMISAWDLLNGPFKSMARDQELRQALYDQMVRLGDILACAFDTPSGIPHDWVDPVTCSADDGTQSTVASVGTVVLEFGRLSDITGDKRYVALAHRAENYMLRPNPSGEPYPGLPGSFVNVATGVIVDATGSWGSSSDSYYEYLLKAYIYNGELYGTYLDRWLVAADSTMRSIGSHPYGHPEWTLLASWDGSLLEQRMESLSWFAGGSFILGGMVTDNQTLVDYGLSIADAAGAVYNMTTTGLGGEFVTWNTSCEGTCDPRDSIQIADGRYRLRPEVLETWYYAYRATKDVKYRDWTWAAFEAMNHYCRTDLGFSGINNVNAVDGGGKDDVQESFVFAEVMKYAYLTHLEDEDAPYHVQDSRTGAKNLWVYNTEAHPLRVAGRPL
ncbi:hypothetical protein LTR56_019699 [Elasticomyces elasticus]|nr:hypothetical protein LTR56_019699 [Elasticomyces elasticus]KAK4911105.1 hypothetical protein LTR49_020272 [Elasticomyces elasticus]KAK5750667.1 hypothetical protein LTS12_019288 [Elasticomyces elasticus]